MNKAQKAPPGWSYGERVAAMKKAQEEHKCDRCGCDLSYSAELHCAKCHRELWSESQ